MEQSLLIIILCLVVVIVTIFTVLIIIRPYSMHSGGDRDSGSTIFGFFFMLAIIVGLIHLTTAESSWLINLPGQLLAGRTSSPAPDRSPGPELPAPWKTPEIAPEVPLSPPELPEPPATEPIWADPAQQANFFFLQVHAFANEENAQQSQTDLSENFGSSMVIYDEDRNLFLVGHGPFASEATALTFHAEHQLPLPPVEYLWE